MGNGAAHYEAEQMIGGFPAVLRCKNIQEIYPYNQVNFSI